MRVEGKGNKRSSRNRGRECGDIVENNKDIREENSNRECGDGRRERNIRDCIRENVRGENSKDRREESVRGIVGNLVYE